MKIVGQEKLVSMIEEHTLDTFPRSVMLVGPSGSGKHSLCSFISTKLNLKIENITENLTLEMIEEISVRVEPRIYVIETSKITVKEENTILKFLEEPLKNAYIVLLCESKNRLLDTIINRCQVWTLEAYSKETLTQFVSDGNEERDLILELAHTPGEVKKYNSIKLSDYVLLASKLVNMIDIASVPNTLTLVDKLCYKNEKDKLDADIFFNVLLHQAYLLAITDDKPYGSICYDLTDKLVNESLVANIDKKNLFERYLIMLWRAVRA